MKVYLDFGPTPVGIVTVPRLTPLVACLSPRRVGLDTRTLFVGFVADKSGTWRQCVLKSSFVFLCHYHSTNDPYSFITDAV
jgi:hypothetical protein